MISRHYWLALSIDVSISIQGRNAHCQCILTWIPFCFEEHLPATCLLHKFDITWRSCGFKCSMIVGNNTTCNECFAHMLENAFATKNLNVHMCSFKVPLRSWKIGVLDAGDGSPKSIVRNWFQWCTYCEWYKQTDTAWYCEKPSCWFASLPLMVTQRKHSSMTQKLNDWSLGPLPPWVYL